MFPSGFYRRFRQTRPPGVLFEPPIFPADGASHQEEEKKRAADHALPMGRHLPCLRMFAPRRVMDVHIATCSASSAAWRGDAHSPLKLPGRAFECSSSGMDAVACLHPSARRSCCISPSPPLEGATELQETGSRCC